MSARTFASWLIAQSHRGDAVGDLSRDFLMDPEHKRINTPGELYIRIGCLSGCTDAREALEAAEREWRRSQLRVLEGGAA